MAFDHRLADESPERSQGRALASGVMAGVVAFSVGALVVMWFLDWENPFGLTGGAAALAAGVAAFHMGTPLGRVFFLGSLTFIGSSLLSWFAGCSMGALILSSSPIDWANPTADLPNTIRTFKILDLWGFILSFLLIAAAAVFGLAYGGNADA